MERKRGASSYQQMFPPFVEGSYAASGECCPFRSDQDNFAGPGIHSDPNRSKLFQSADGDHQSAPNLRDFRACPEISRRHHAPLLARA